MSVRSLEVFQRCRKGRRGLRASQLVQHVSKRCGRGRPGQARLNLVAAIAGDPDPIPSAAAARKI